MEARPMFSDTSSSLLEDANHNKKLLGKLIHLTFTCHFIVYTISGMSHFMQEPQQVHYKGVLHVLAYIKLALRIGPIY